MLSIFDNFRDLTMQSLVLRLFLAFICGGFIGIERTIKRRAAGLRTHILVCVGAAVAMLANQYVILELKYYADVSRIGAQVVAGVGFIGAGAIVISKKQRIRGLTTAAGLWACAIIGLCLGAGFFEAGILGTILMLFAEVVLSRVAFIMQSRNNLTLFIEYDKKTALDLLFKYFNENKIRLFDIEITKNSTAKDAVTSGVFTLGFPNGLEKKEIIKKINSVKGVKLTQEL